MQPREVPDLMTPGEVAAAFKVDPRSVNLWAKNGRLPTATRTPGGHRRYKRSVVEALLAASIEERTR